ncbi:hypothetical protein ACE10Z_13980 [Bradyrhizobium sp. Pha-3]|uniref:hypothetical protein n=1 Tax=Bradyrhizobium sp. Pha-3 TaxID=208375 RepID=UPI0035D4CE18
MPRIWSALKFAAPTARAAVSSTRGIIACYNKIGRRQNDQRMFVLIMQNPHAPALQSYGAMAQGPLATLVLEQSRQVASNEKE